jgi:hypothetical protein
MSFLIIVLAQFLVAGPVLAGDDSSRAEPISDSELIQLLLSEIAALKSRVAMLETEPKGAAPPPVTADAAPPASSPVAVSAPSLPPSAPGATVPASAPPTPAPVPKPSPVAAADPEPQDGGHTMSIPGGPSLTIRGFLDFNLDVGTAANPLVYPVTSPPSAIHNGFQFGEFDLFLNSKLSTDVSFLSEMVFSSGPTNTWGIDIERAQLTYKPSPYFQVSGGRMHTAIGYYNTAFHHGTWFETPTGRPFMYYFEDSGGILPVHIVGLEAAGLIPRTGSLNAHWIFQVGNGLSTLYLTNPVLDPVENFLPETNHKAFNVAGYIRPSWARGLQIGANFYDDRRVPVGFPHVDNYIPGLYAIYITSTWEFLNEFELQREHPLGSTITYNTPLGYTQLSRKFGKFRPYFRWQEVNVPVNDPLYSIVGRYEGPSEGLRMDFTDFAALKVQYNRIYTRNPLPMNGVDAQVSFTF